VPRDTKRFGRALLWTAIAIAVGVGVLGVIAGTWKDILIAAVLAALAALALVVGQTRTQR
jgi:uncharacterized membrane protein YjjP (DUF1212 family)